MTDSSRERDNGRAEHVRRLLDGAITEEQRANSIRGSIPLARDAANARERALELREKASRLLAQGPPPVMASDSPYLAEFMRGYIACALWSSVDENGDPLGDSFDSEDFTSETRRRMEEDCTDFITAQWPDLVASGGDPGQHGHDFWLTRNRHGAGFWDRGYGAMGQRLTDAAHVYGGADLYVTDDGQVSS